MSSDVIENIARLLGRLVYLDQIQDANVGRAHEVRALRWVLDLLAEQYPDESKEALRQTARSFEAGAYRPRWHR